MKTTSPSAFSSLVTAASYLVLALVVLMSGCATVNPPTNATAYQPGQGKASALRAHMSRSAAIKTVEDSLQKAADRRDAIIGLGGKSNVSADEAGIKFAWQVGAKERARQKALVGLVGVLNPLTLPFTASALANSGHGEATVSYAEIKKIEIDQARKEGQLMLYVYAKGKGLWWINEEDRDRFLAAMESLCPNLR